MPQRKLSDLNSTQFLARFVRAFASVSVVAMSTRIPTFRTPQNNLTAVYTYMDWLNSVPRK
jgi:hypothetical protein